MKEGRKIKVWEFLGLHKETGSNEMRKKLSIPLAALCIVLLGGCQNTPEESAVAAHHKRS